MIIAYANQHNIILNINENGWFPFLSANAGNINNVNIVKLLIEYVNKNNIILEVNEKTPNGWSPLNLCIVNNNVEIVKSIIEFEINN